MAEVTLSRDDSGRITITFPYDPLYVQEIKTIEGHRWHPDKKHWSFPNTDGTLKKILKVFEGEEIQLDPALQSKLSTPVIARHEVPKQSQKDYNNLNAPTLANAISPIPPLEKGGEGGFGDCPRFTDGARQSRRIGTVP